MFVVASLSLTIASFLASLLNLFITAGSKPSEELLKMFEERKDPCTYYQSRLTFRLKELSIAARSKSMYRSSSVLSKGQKE